MKNNKTKPKAILLSEWGKKFSPDEKAQAKKRNNYHQVVKEFKRARKSLGLTQQQLASKAGMDRTIITKIETGARNTTLNSLIMIADAMDKKLKITFD